VVPDVNVSAYGEGYPASGTTGSNGVAWFRLPPGQFVLFGKKQGLSQAEMDATVAEGQTNRVKLELDLPPRGIVSNEPERREALAQTNKTPLSPGPQLASSNTPLKWIMVGMVLFGIGAVVFSMTRKRKP
jgi:hypothetical protein